MFSFGFLGRLCFALCLFSLTYCSYLEPEFTPEIPVRAFQLGSRSQNGWLVNRNAVGKESGGRTTYVVRLKHLRSEKITVEVTKETDSGYLIRSYDLQPRDFILLDPQSVPIGKPVVPITGLSDERLIELTLEAGLAAITIEDLEESVRFISADYVDKWGFNQGLMRKLIEEAYEEFDEPLIELDEPPEIQIKNQRAVVEAKVRLSAVYRGRRNYLLGDKDTPNHLFVQFDKTEYGWKVSSVNGLRPLGFEERFLRLLGSNIGLALTESEVKEKDQACMPCRSRMAERFGTSD